MNDNSAKGLSCQSEVIGLLITLTHARYLDAAAGGAVAVCPCIIHVSPFYAYLVHDCPPARPTTYLDLSGVDNRVNLPINQIIKHG